MRIQKIDNQQNPQKSFKMKFFIPKEVHNDFLSRLDIFEKTNNYNKKNIMIGSFDSKSNLPQNIAIKAKGFLATFERHLLEHNANPKNHIAYDDVVTITKIDYCKDTTVDNEWESLLSEKTKPIKHSIETNEASLTVKIDKGFKKNYAFFGFNPSSPNKSLIKQNLLTTIQDSLTEEKNHLPIVDEDLAYLLNKMEQNKPTGK